MRRAGRFALAVACLAALLAPAHDAGAAARATYVGIVISGHGTGCVKWHPGISGDEVLTDIANVHYRRDGIIDQIDGQPSPPHADTTHYWSYWHDTGSGWSYSGVGAGASSPAAGSVEGWSFDNGGSSAGPPANNPNGLYASLCGSHDPQPAPHHTPPPATRHAVATAGAHAPASASPSQASPAQPRSTRASSRASAPRSSSAISTAYASTSSAAEGSVAPVIVDNTAAAHRPRSPSGSLTPLIVTLLLVALLGGAAAITVLLRRGQAE